MVASNQTRGADFVGSVGRALAVLECFGTEEALRLQGRMTLTDAAKLTDLSRGTARRLLLTLVELHYVDTDGKYFWLTPKLVNLSRGYLMPMGLGEGSRAILYSLTQKMDESASVGVLDGAEIVYVERVEVRRIYSSRITSGTRLPAASSSIGRVLLAALSDKDLGHWLDAYPIEKLTNKTVTDRDAFMKEITKVRAEGCATIDEELELGIRSISVPIFSANDRIMAALNASTLSPRHSVEDMKNQFLPELLKASEKLSQTMAW